MSSPGQEAFRKRWQDFPAGSRALANGEEVYPHDLLKVVALVVARLVASSKIITNLDDVFDEIISGRSDISRFSYAAKTTSMRTDLMPSRKAQLEIETLK